jgi:hypothetical protein
MGKNVKIGPTLSQIWLSVIDKKQAHYEATFVHRVFSARYELTRKFETLRKRTSLAAVCNSRIAKSFPGQVRISVEK